MSLLCDKRAETYHVTGSHEILDLTAFSTQK